MNPEILYIKESHSEKYPPRTYYNAKNGDVTIALATDLSTAGEKLTHKAAGEKYIGFQLTPEISTLDIARGLYRKLQSSQAKTLNVAGNGIYTLIKSGISQAEINQFVYEIIAQVHHFWPLERIYCGGQTGVDLAGAVAGYKLGIPTEVTLPKGFIQRFETGGDVTGTQESIFTQINDGAKALQDYTPVSTKKPKV